MHRYLFIRSFLITHQKFKLFLSQNVCPIREILRTFVTFLDNICTIESLAGELKLCECVSAADLQ